MENEADMVRRAQQGDTAAFEQLVLAHGRLLYNLTFRLTGNLQEAEDLAQETFLRAWRGLRDFRLASRFSTWLFRIAMNLCYNRMPRLRREMDSLAVEDDQVSLPDESQNLEAYVLEGELQAYLQQAMQALSPSYRLLLTLRHQGGMSYQEISDATGLPLGSVKAGLHRGRQNLRAALEKYEVLDG